ncbi:glycyl radical enzyme [Clostridia bacterium]|nr:glycyl radical enzyme [Clostridia bacterium]
MPNTSIAALYAIGEPAAAGLLEAIEEGLPFPREYGRAYRRLYEHMPVRVSDEFLLAPFEALYETKISSGDSMNNGHASGGKNGEHHAVSFIVNPFHANGLEFRRDIADEKKAKYPEHAELIDSLENTVRSYLIGRWGYIHSNPDIEQVVGKGFNYYKKIIAEGIADAKREGDDIGLNFLLALEDYAKGIDVYYSRVISAVADAVESAIGERKRKLAVIRDELAKSFMEPCTSVVQGILAVNFTWMLDFSDSIGRPDLVLSKLFDADKAAGSLDIELVRELLDNQWKLFERHNGWNMQIGGLAPDGGNIYCDFTKELILANTRNKLRRPNLALRVTKDMPEDIFDLALDSIAAGTGKPTLYNDELYVETLRSLFPELTEADARRYGFGGCTETMVAGHSCVDSLGGGINLADSLERVINGGTLRRDGADKCRNALLDYNTFDEFLQAYKDDLAQLTHDRAVQWNDSQTRFFTSGDPKIMRSMFTRGCIENRRSFEAGGAKYNWNVISYDGSTVVTDSLCAIKHIVYDTKQVTREDLYNALANNFAGYENVLNLLRNAPKFGNDIAEVDDLAHDYLDHAWQKALDEPMARGGRVVPSVILFATYAGSGAYLGASANGRLAGEPLNDSIGAIAGNDKKGPTALINSVLKLPHTKAVGTPVFNIRFSKELASSKVGREAIKDLIRTYFERGGLQIQATVLSSEEMRKAQKEPEKYSDLIVRIGGYSEYFVYLSKTLQETVIARAEY